MDFTLKKARTTETFTARFKKTLKKTDRLKKAKKIGVDCGGVIASLINAGTCWGAAITGATGRQTKARRTLAHVVLTKQPRGRSVTVDLSLAKLSPFIMDPIFRLQSDPVFTLAKAVGDKWVPPHWLAAIWQDPFWRANSGRTTWKTATDPLSVTL